MPAVNPQKLSGPPKLGQLGKGQDVVSPTAAPREAIQFSPVAQSCPTLCNPLDCSTPGFLVHHQLPELTQTHVQQVGEIRRFPHKKTLLEVDSSVAQLEMFYW